MVKNIEKYLNYASRHHESNKIFLRIYGVNCNKISVNYTSTMALEWLHGP